MELGTECAPNSCAGIGSLQLGVVLVFLTLAIIAQRGLIMATIVQLGGAALFFWVNGVIGRFYSRYQLSIQ